MSEKWNGISRNFLIIKLFCPLFSNCNIFLFITVFQVGSHIEANKVSTIIQEITNMAGILPDTSVNGKLDNIIRQLITKYLYNESVTDCMTIISTSEFRTRIPSIDAWIQQLPGIIRRINFTKKFPEI